MRKVDIDDMNRCCKVGFRFIDVCKPKDRKQIEADIEEIAEKRGIQAKLRRRQNDQFLLCAEGFEALETTERPWTFLRYGSCYRVYVEPDRQLFDAIYRGKSKQHWDWMSFGIFEVYIEISPRKFICVSHDDLPYYILEEARSISEQGE